MPGVVLQPHNFTANVMYWWKRTNCPSTAFTFNSLYKSHTKLPLYLQSPEHCDSMKVPKHTGMAGLTFFLHVLGWTFLTTLNKVLAGQCSQATFSRVEFPTTNKTCAPVNVNFITPEKLECSILCGSSSFGITYLTDGRCYCYPLPSIVDNSGSASGAYLNGPRYTVPGNENNETISVKTLPVFGLSMRQKVELLSALTRKSNTSKCSVKNFLHSMT